MASSSVRESFDRLAGEYDAIKLRVIPGYRDVQALVDRYAAVPDRAPARVLELGLGTGEWAERLLQRHPNVAFEGVDFSERMRDIAGRRLDRFRERVRLHDADLDEEEIAHVLRDHRENDLPETVESQLGYLQQAGFDPAAVAWCHGKFVLFFGRRRT
jgi:predicted TPR repeat methyltransferase